MSRIDQAEIGTLSDERSPRRLKLVLANAEQLTLYTRRAQGLARALAPLPVPSDHG